MNQRATIDDVAARAGVSIKTVSRVINREPNVSTQTRARVERAVRELRYAPNPAARGLAAGRSSLLGLAYDNPSESYLARIQSGVLGALDERGYGLVLLPCVSQSRAARAPALGDGAGDPAAQLLARATRARVEGLILTPPVADNEAVLTLLKRRRVPFVRIAPQQSQRGLVVKMDDRAAARELVTLMLQRGHRRIGIVRGHPDHGASEARYRGYADALAAQGIGTDRMLVYRGAFDFESGRRAGAYFLDLPAAPSAIFACNDDMAAGVLHEAHARSIAVPGALSVAGFDDSPMAAQLWPALTTIRQPVAEMGLNAVHLLVDALEGGPRETRLELDYSLVVRDSIGPRERRGSRGA